MRFSGLLASALVISSSPSGAAAQQRPNVVAYDVAAGCPEVAEFNRKLAERTTSARVEPSSSAPADIQVAVRDEGGVFRGTIDVATPEGRQRRAIDGENCADLVSALALSASLMIEGGSAAGTSARPRPAAPPVGSAAPRADAATADAEPPARWRWATGARFEAMLVVGSDWALGPGVFVELRRQRASLFAPSARLGASYSVASIEGSRGSARLQWIAGRAQGCPIHLGGETFGVDPCAGIAFGAVYGEGEVENPESELAGWVAADVGARARILLWDRLLLEAEGNAILPISRYRLLFRDPEEELGEVRTLGVGVAIGAGAVF